ncbi:hypothetical protein [Companilactobacillus versmoldensis]|uniref:Uncharacterized protein n=1 Tax=Companilactobacillus versmoldensis DSM 14857 = KCTC 3814 TaxID=1423815 RepID=A0A0R1SFL0_9LACO|nr:hypothetical protein [Companilactobacillus versmoldensis]KRL68189.1 hypothetical protein FC27_GL000930 [Companilactobacillus versmoldensis DSM 14857 = KCTC 3814]
MSNQNIWLVEQVKALAKKQPEYEDRAFLYALQSVIKEQQKRTEQIQGELDGRLWNHDNW